MKDDLNFGKVFSVIVYYLRDLFEKNGLLKSTVEDIQAGGQKFKLENSELKTIFLMLKNSEVDKVLQKLDSYSDELSGFVLNYQDVGSHPLGMAGRKQVNVTEKFRALSRQDKEVKPHFIESMTSLMQIPVETKHELMEIDNCYTFIFRFNEYLINSTTNKDYQREKLQALSEGKQRLHDLLSFEKERFVVDPKKFSLMLHDFRKSIQKQPDQV